MSMSGRNRFLQILHKQGCKREFIPRIMSDLAEIFADEETIPADDDVDFLAARAEIELSDGDPAQRVKAWRRLIEEDRSFRQKRSQEAEEASNARIEAIQRELIVRGLVSEKDHEDRTEEEIERHMEITVLQYGRSPLHQAIVAGEMDRAEEFIKAGMFLTDKDNNGNTAQELAYLMGSHHALALFEKYVPSRVK